MCHPYQYRELKPRKPSILTHKSEFVGVVVGHSIQQTSYGHLGKGNYLSGKETDDEKTPHMDMGSPHILFLLSIYDI